MQQDKPTAGCGGYNGTLPGSCAPMVFPYVAMQGEPTNVYSQNEALASGTLFPGLNLPFHRAMEGRMSCKNQPLCELMALDFAITEMGLYLDTHSGDKEAFALFQKYVQMAKEGRAEYERRYGPLQQCQTAAADSYVWPEDPWPWNMEGGKK